MVEIKKGLVLWNFEGYMRWTDTVGWNKWRTAAAWQVVNLVTRGEAIIIDTSHFSYAVINSLHTEDE